MTPLTRSLSALAVLAMSSLASPAQADAGPLIERFQQSGVTVGIAGYPPYGYQLIDGTITGEQVETVKHVLGEMGITDIRYTAMDFGALIPSLNAGRIDMAAAGIYIRPSRCEQVLFSEPTFGQGAAYIVAAGNPLGLTNFRDIAANPDATLAVLAGGTEETLAKRDGVPDEQLMRVGDQASGIAAVVSGRADGFALSAFAIFDIVRTAGEMIGVEATPSITEIAGEVYKGHGAIAFPKGSNDDELAMHMAFRDAFDAIMAEYMDSGAYLEMASRWGFSEADGPVMTMEELCAEGL